MKKEKTEIKIVKIKECVPNWWNPNEMNARQFTSLKKALTKYGQTKPIQVGVWPNMKVKAGYVIVGGYHMEGTPFIRHIVYGVDNSAGCMKQAAFLV